MKKFAGPLLLLVLAACATPPAPATQAVRAAALLPKLPFEGRKTLNTEIPKPFEDVSFFWAFTNGVVEGGGSSISVSLHVSQDPRTGALDGTLFAQSSIINRSFLGSFTGGQIDYATHTAHLSGRLVEGTPFQIALASKEGPGDPNLVSLTIPGAVSITGTIHAGDVRVLKAAPLGIDFRGTPGLVYDYQTGLFVAAVDQADGPVEPQDVPDNQFVNVSFDPVELPNGTFPGEFNAVPGIGNNIPVIHDDTPFFPQGIPAFEPNHPMLLGVDIFGA
jgi:hypothetical protein